MATSSRKFTKQRLNLEHSEIFFAIFGVFSFVIAESAYVDLHKTKQGKATEANQYSINNDICVTSGCRKAANIILNNMDQKMEPCHDFYQFACGGYINSTLKPDDDFEMNQSTLTDEKVKKQMRMTYEAITATNQTRHVRLAKNIYDNCMNTSRIEADGLTPLQNILKKLGGWPVLEGHKWVENDFDYINTSFQFINAGYPGNMLFGPEVFINMYNNDSWSMIYLNNPDSGLSYLRRKNFTAYYEYMVDIAVYLGANRNRAKNELRKSLIFQIKLYNLGTPLKKNRNRQPIFTTLGQLAENYSNIAWKEIFAALLPSTTIITDENFVFVHKDCNVTRLQKLLTKSPRRIIANYMFWRVVDRSILYLNEQMRNRYYALFDHRYELEPRWKMCISEVIQSLPMSAGALYVKNYFPEEAKAAAVEMTLNVKNGFKNNIKKVDWMDNAMKKDALEQIDRLILFTAYPDELLNDTEINSYYQSLELTGENFLESYLNVSLFRARNSPTQIPLDKDKWRIIGTAADVTASYDVDLNVLFLPAGMLQGIYFNVDRPGYMNYGGIGSVIGHELTHGFHIGGKYFNNYNDPAIMWNPAYKANFDKRTRCIVEQYNTYSFKLFGDNTSGNSKLKENIADNVGYKQSYHAYVAWETANKPEQALPGLPYTPRQMFWISLANTLCTKSSSDAQNDNLFDDHSPSDFRVIAPLSNSVEFSKDFNCPIGSRMNPTKKCVLW